MIAFGLAYFAWGCLFCGLCLFGFCLISLLAVLAVRCLVCFVIADVLNFAYGIYWWFCYCLVCWLLVFVVFDSVCFLVVYVCLVTCFGGSLGLF